MAEAPKSMNMKLPTKKTSSISNGAKGYISAGPTQSGWFTQKGVESDKTYASSNVVRMSLTKNAQWTGGLGANVIFTQPMFFSPLHTPQNWQIASKRREIYQWARFYYENEPKVAAGIDFYSQFPLNGFTLECKSRKILHFYERLVKKLQLNTWFKKISHEYFLLGDVFVWTDIDCPKCKGSQINPDDGEACNHPDGTINNIRILNPDWIEVNKSQIGGDAQYVMLPDEELYRIVMSRQPKHVFDQLSPMIKEFVASKRPFPLSNRSCSHLKHRGVAYGVYGESLVRRLFTILAYKTKLMTANWIIAERLILPIRVVKVGDKDRPAGPEDLADVTNQLAQISNDPNLTLVTHHAFDVEWVGACYDKETQILTNEGWKYFYEISQDEVVGTYNIDNEKLEYQQIEKYYEYDFESNNTLKMYHFDQKSVDVMVTPNHRMLVERKGKKEIVYSQNVKHDDKFISSLNWDGSIPADIPFKDSPLSHMSLDEYLKLAGYYLSEGGLKINKKTLKSGVEKKYINGFAFSQCLNNKCFNEIVSSINNTKNHVSTYLDDRYDNECLFMTVNNSQFARYMSDTFGSHSFCKNIPTWIKNLPKDKLKILFDAMMNGDGDTRNDGILPRHRYSTTSLQLANDVVEIGLKLGYFPRLCDKENRKKIEHRQIYRVYFSENRKNTKFNIRKQHIKKIDYKDKVYCVRVPNSFVVVRRNGVISVQGNSGKIQNITAELELVNKEILDGLMLNQSLLNGEMSGYSSAQVGVETMIQRIEVWRNELAEWAERHIFLPIAQMQGFVDEKESEEAGETCYIYPTIKWNDLRLRDNTNKLQAQMQLHDKGILSTQTLLEGFEMDYDQEIRRIREEQVSAGPNGQIMGGGAGGMGGGAGGAMGGLGGAGGMPGGDPMGGVGGMPGGMPGGDPMGGGGAMGGAPAGGMGGGAAGAMGGGMGAAASGTPDKIYKPGKGPKEKEEDIQPIQPQVIQFTKPEMKIYSMIQQLDIPYPLYAQFKQQIPGQPQPYVMDFAFPHVGINIEADGTTWHEDEEDVKRDKERDLKLASAGWRVLRFPETAINERSEEIKKVIYDNVLEAAKEKAQMSKKSYSWQNQKYKTSQHQDGSLHKSIITTKCIPDDK